MLPLHPVGMHAPGSTRVCMSLPLKPRYAPPPAEREEMGRSRSRSPPRRGGNDRSRSPRRGGGSGGYRSPPRRGGGDRSPPRGGRGGGDRSRTNGERISLLVRNLGDRIDPGDLKDAFGRYGHVKDVYIPTDFYTK